MLSLKRALEICNPQESAKLIQSSFSQFQNKREIDKFELLPLFQYPSTLKILKGKELENEIKRMGIKKNISLLHSIAHIEFNAMMAYSDTLLRFVNSDNFEGGNEKIDFANDMFSIAQDEATHFLSLSNYLDQIGFSYGKMPVISALLETVKNSTEKLEERLALISIFQEGKGLDAGPHLLSILKDNDKEGFSILEKIIQEEVSHVAYGLKWFEYICKRNKKQPSQEFKTILQKHGLKINPKQLNWELRKKTGLSMEFFD